MGAPSQTGWVVPKIAAERNIAFSILVSLAINWIRHNDYYVEQQMTKQNFSSEENEAKRKYEKDLIKLMQEDASYEDYSKIAEEDDNFTRERWIFAKKNVNADATADLKKFISPVYLVIGSADKILMLKRLKKFISSKLMKGY